MGAEIISGGELYKNISRVHSVIKEELNQLRKSATGLNEYFPREKLAISTNGH